MRARLSSEHIGSGHAVLPGGIFFFGAAEAIEVCRDAYVLKPQVAQERHELCLQQSAGDSTSPQINVATNVIAKSGVEYDIAKLQPSAGT